MSRRICVTVLSLACLGLVTAPAADAKLTKAIWGPYELPAGNAACPTPKAPCSAFPTYKQLGVDVFQFQIHWDEVAPTRPANPRDPNDPAYHWGEADTIVQQAAEYGIGLAALIQRAPGWANGGRSPIWAPTTPKSFADFAYAASKRYPSVRRWMIWGEPSRKENFLPMKEDDPRGPEIYAAILDRTYGVLKEASRSNKVIGGMTLNGGTVMPPQFLKYLKLKNGRPPRMDYWGDNPFDARYPHLADDPIGRFRGFNDIDTLHEEIARTYKRGHRKVPKLWLSEWTIVSDRPLQLFSGFFVSRRNQAQRLSAAYEIASRTPYVAALGWFTLLDQTPGEGDARWGLMQADGVPKPAFAAYQKVP
jgi:hypothetical protein